VPGLDFVSITNSFRFSAGTETVARKKLRRSHLIHSNRFALKIMHLRRCIVVIDAAAGSGL
jgi:hypothetical protein